MRVLIATFGGRGDVAPFTGLGTAIRTAGHSVTITSNAEFEAMVTGCGLEFVSLPGTQGMFDDPRWVRESGAFASPVKMFRLLAEYMRKAHKGILAVAREQAADVLALSGIAILGGFHVAEGLGLPAMGLLAQPIHPTGDFPHSYVAGHSLGRLGNRAAGTATAAALALGMAGPAMQIRRELGLPRRRAGEAWLGQPFGRRWPVFYGFSPTVVPRPADWPDNCQVCGYWWPQRPASWSPPPEVEKFLEADSPPVFFGFGDMTPADPEELIELAAAAGRQAGVRQVIQAGQAGPASPARQPAADSIVIGDIPHDWLFRRVAAVVHHAGGGTVAAGLRAGVPAVTVPVLADQPFWAARLAALGVGPPPIPRKQLSVPALAAAIRDAVARPSYRTRAQALSRQLASEDGAAPVMSMLARLGRS